MKNFSGKNVAYIGVAAASLTAVKYALSWLANVELITLLLVFYTLTLGKNKTLFACNVFIVVECMLYGVGAWVISYFIHWNTVVLVTDFLIKLGVRHSLIYALSCVLLTILFGLQTTAFEILIYSPKTEFFSAFSLRYFMGLSFFITHVISAFVSVAFLLPILCKIPAFQTKKKIIL